MTDSGLEKRSAADPCRATQVSARCERTGVRAPRSDPRSALNDCTLASVSAAACRVSTPGRRRATAWNHCAWALPTMAGLERDWQRDVHLTSRLEALESRRRDADDGERSIAERHCAADRAGGAAEPALPVSIANHGDRWIQSLVADGHQPSGRRRHSQHLEVVPGGDLSKHLLDGPLHFHSQLVCVERSHPRKRRSLFSDALEVRIGRRATEALVSRGPDEDQLLPGSSPATRAAAPCAGG